MSIKRIELSLQRMEYIKDISQTDILTASKAVQVLLAKYESKGFEETKKSFCADIREIYYEKMDAWEEAILDKDWWLRILGAINTRNYLTLILDSDPMCRFIGYLKTETSPDTDPNPNVILGLEKYRKFYCK